MSDKSVFEQLSDEILNFKREPKIPTKKIVINYPPNFDGELHILVDEDNWSYTFNFTHAKTGNAWETLVSAAKGILAQDERKTKKGLK